MQKSKVDHLQLALSMAGIIVNTMTCELILAISAKVDEVGDKFSLADAQILKNHIEKKYATPPPSLPMPKNMPEDLKKMIESGAVHATFKKKEEEEG